MFVINGTKIDITRPYNSGSVKYPNLLEPSWRAALGVIEVPDPTFPDPRISTYTENADGSIVVSPIPIEAVKAREIARIRKEARDIIEAKYPVFRQLNAALGAYPAAYLTQLRSDIAAVVSASNTAEASISAATTADQAIAVTATWPAI